jgi:hypothetical protein
LRWRLTEFLCASPEIERAFEFVLLQIGRVGIGILDTDVD